MTSYRPWPAIAVLVGLTMATGAVAPADARVAVEDEIRCLALNVYFESRSEPDVGKLAVAHVVMNLVADRRFAGSVCGVIRQGGDKVRHKCQFSWWCDGQTDRPLEARAWERSRAIARAVYLGVT
ncbi:MAG: hypothetical protein FJX67_07405 [Alphaproteobacteria bacterium]|nr:hypothetical protein [Alphaproteobacteria bacterium]